MEEGFLLIFSQKNQLYENIKNCFHKYSNTYCKIEIRTLKVKSEHFLCKRRLFIKSYFLKISWYGETNFVS